MVKSKKEKKKKPTLKGLIKDSRKPNTYLQPSKASLVVRDKQLKKSLSQWGNTKRGVNGWKLKNLKQKLNF